MIFKLIFDDRQEFAQAQSQLHLLQSYSEDYEGFQDINEVVEISEEEAKIIMLTNTDYDENDPESPAEIPLYDMVVGDDFAVVASADWE